MPVKQRDSERALLLHLNIEPAVHVPAFLIYRTLTSSSRLIKFVPAKNERFGKIPAVGTNGAEISLAGRTCGLPGFSAMVLLFLHIKPTVFVLSCDFHPRPELFKMLCGVQLRIHSNVPAHRILRFGGHEWLGKLLTPGTNGLEIIRPKKDANLT
jgi:hypothetical protein